MVIPLVAVAGKITAGTMNKVIAAVNRNALNGIVPTSVEGDGVTVAPNGAVSFINSPAVSLNGVFSGNFDNYRITWNSNNRSSSGSTQFHLRTGGTDSGSNYDFTKTVANGTSTTTSSSSSASAVPLDQGVTAGQHSSGVIDLFGPALTKYTLGTCQSAVLAASNLYGCTISIAQETETAFDGFSMYPLTTGASWSGVLRVYGYNTLS